MGLLTMTPDAILDAFSGFAKEGGRVGSGSLGSGTGGVARCVR
ncbi:hypothetical protein ACFO3J_25980 [Streptomyces polygonati]|uniref:Sulfate adenylyltransferase n=1 Tax=Streptomyces polygonati TaxID=1617087 RepID=A0ABV8HS39_9ACTN